MLTFVRHGFLQQHDHNIPPHTSKTNNFACIFNILIFCFLINLLFMKIFKKIFTMEIWGHQGIERGGWRCRSRAAQDHRHPHYSLF